MEVLVSGAGIAGPCLAYWLRRHGFHPVIVERSPQLRTGGYVIDFWGAGFEVADRMGLASRLMHEGYQVKEVREVDRDGVRVSGFGTAAFERVAKGRFTSLPRGALAASIYDTLGSNVETLFGDSVTALEQEGDRLRVQFEKNAPRTFDLVIGADGLHSKVRKLAFGDEARFERYLGMKVAAFEVSGYRPRDELVYVTHTAVGQQIGRFAMRDDRTMFLFLFHDPDPSLPEGLAAQKDLLRDRFSDSGWESPRILAALDGASELYMDRVSQIQMERWSQGRVALVGDAAFCVSLLAGQGSALAMISAYVLAGELLAAGGRYHDAFERYEARLRDYMHRKQEGAERFAGAFAPRTRAGLFFRNQVIRAFAIPGLARLAVGRDIADRLELPNYDWPLLHQLAA